MPPWLVGCFSLITGLKDLRKYSELIKIFCQLFWDIITQADLTLQETSPPTGEHHHLFFSFYEHSRIKDKVNSPHSQTKKSADVIAIAVFSSSVVLRLSALSVGSIICKILSISQNFLKLPYATNLQAYFYDILDVFKACFFPISKYVSW